MTFQGQLSQAQNAILEIAFFSAGVFGDFCPFLHEFQTDYHIIGEASFCCSSLLQSLTDQAE